MPRIHQLPSTVITKIAAGEVIERPASVIKELLENSIDAGATRIDIDLEQGGTELIRVVDDGCGIEADDLPLAFASHATSKLQDADDLFRINTMGFRGEALASIGGVARVTLQSRAAGQSSGAEITSTGGEIGETKPWNGAFGTRIEVKNLFFNTPVRKKFLRAISTELGHVLEMVNRLALAHPTLHFVVKHNNRLSLEVPASADLLERIALFFGAEVRDHLFPIQAKQGNAALSGFIADPACERGNTKLQFLYLNKRWIRDRSLAHALQESYRGLLMSGRYAVAFLFLTLPPDEVDVNVHPTKSEVRFRDAQGIYHLIRGSIRQRLSDEHLIPQLQAPPPQAAPIAERFQSPQPTGNPELFRDTMPTMRPAPTPPASWSAPQGGPRRETAEQTIAPWEKAPLPPAPSPTVVPVPAVSPSVATTPKVEPPVSPVSPVIPDKGLVFGPALQIHDAYLVIETPEGMLVIDQHALHERILYEQLRSRIRQGELEVQRLLIPEPVDLTPEQAACVLEAKDELKTLGVEVEDFGGNTVLVGSYPTLLSRSSPTTILKSIVDCLSTKERAPTKEQMLHNLLATMSCKAAVKAGDKLTPEEIDYLMQLRQMAEDSHHCPHGRPTSLAFSRHELDKQFRRI